MEVEDEVNSFLNESGEAFNNSHIKSIWSVINTGEIFHFLHKANWCY